MTYVSKWVSSGPQTLRQSGPWKRDLVSLSTKSLLSFTRSPTTKDRIDPLLTSVLLGIKATPIRQRCSRVLSNRLNDSLMPTWLMTPVLITRLVTDGVTG